MSAYRKPADAQTKSQLFLRYRQQVVTLNEQHRSALLGRDAGCDMVIQTKLASRQHALVEYNFGKFLLTDHSSNGTFIRFSDNQVIELTHQQIVLHGSGHISFGQSFAESPSEIVEYFLQ